MKKTPFATLSRKIVKLAQRQPKAAIEQLIEDLRSVVATQRAQPAGSYVQELVNCGKKKCRTCSGGTRPGHGPYWYYYRVEAHKTVKKYIGKNLPDGIQPPNAP
jgi:hypothetical protein